MCGGPSRAEKQAAADQRMETELAKSKAIEEKALEKREDITEALTARTKRKGLKGGGYGKRSLISSGSGAGFLKRFGS